jgi:hypothetical protein
MQTTMQTMMQQILQRIPTQKSNFKPKLLPPKLMKGEKSWPGPNHRFRRLRNSKNLKGRDIPANQVFIHEACYHLLWSWIIFIVITLIHCRRGNCLRIYPDLCMLTSSWSKNFDALVECYHVVS